MGIYSSFIHTFYLITKKELEDIDQEIENSPDITRDLSILLIIRKREINSKLDVIYQVYKMTKDLEESIQEIPLSTRKLKSLSSKHKRLKKYSKRLKLKNKDLKEKIIELQDRIEEDIPYMLRTR